MGNATFDVRIPDVLTFLSVVRHKSVTAAARDLRVTPSQVSKAVARLEVQLKRPLLARRGRGIVASDEGEKIVPQLEDLLAKVRSLSQMSEVPPELKLTVAAPSYLCAFFLPSLVAAVPDARFRGLECGPAFMRAYATENLFQVAITVGEERLSDAWSVTRAGVLRRALFASPALAKSLGASPSKAKLLAHPFVMPVYNGGGQFLPGDDGCPLGEERIVGHEAETVGVALEIAAATDQLVFGPMVSARPLVQAGRLVAIDVPGWDRTESLFLHTNADRVLARVERALAEALRRTARED